MKDNLRSGPKTVMLDIPATAEERAARSAMIAEVESLKDAVVGAAVAWHESGREGDDTWPEKGEALASAIDKLLARRAEPLSRTPTDKADMSDRCEADDPTTDAEKSSAIVDEINRVCAADPTRFVERSFAMIWNEGHSVRLINRENPRWAISIPWDDIDPLVRLLTGTRPVAVSTRTSEDVGEIARLKRGDFTPDELQNLCHNLPEADREAFIAGCIEYQRKLFGVSQPDVAEKARRAAAGLHCAVDSKNPIRLALRRDLYLVEMDALAEFIIQSFTATERE